MGYANHGMGRVAKSIFDQTRLKLTCSTTETIAGLVKLQKKTPKKKKKTKALIRLHGCAYCSVPFIRMHQNWGFSHRVPNTINVC